MKKTPLLALLLVSFLFVGCREEDNPYKEFEQERLARLAAEKFEAIELFAQPTSCTDPSEWEVAEIQSVCGPSHIAFHQTTDKRKLRDLINDYNLLMEIYRPYVAPFINCAPYREPTGISCEGGEAIVKYPAYQEPSN